MNIWDAVTDTVDSIGSAAIAVPGMVWDSATLAIPGGEEASFGNWVNKISARGSDMFDPIMNDDTLTGMGFTKVMDGLETAYREGISEPGATAITMYSSVKSNPLNWDSIFSGKAWGDAYEIAQNRSIGQAAAIHAYNTAPGGAAWDDNALDPMDERAYKQLNKAHPVGSTMVSGSYDFAARWYLDPGVIAGKGIKAFKAAGRTIKTEDRANLKKVLDGEVEAAHGFKPMDTYNKWRARDIKSRYEDTFNFIDTGAKGERLNSTQMYVGIPELRDAANGRQLAALLEDAGKITDDTVRRDQYRSIFSVANGDMDEAFAKGAELGQVSHIRDELKNIAKGNVVDLKSTALGHQILANPVLNAHLQGQLDRMPQVKSALDNHVRRLEMLVGRQTDEAVESADTGVQGVLGRKIPTVTASGKRAIGREENRGLLRDGNLNTGRDAIDNFAAARAEQVKRMAKHDVVQTVFQKSPTSVPARIITGTAGLAAKATLGYARTPQRIADALRRTHPTGFASLHDWDSTSNQLDQMLSASAVEHGKRWELMSKAHLARTEAERQRVIEDIEHESILGLAEKYGVIPKAKAAAEAEGQQMTSQYLRDFVSAVVKKGNEKRAVHMAPRSGRVYGAATYNDPLRASTAARAEKETAARLRVDQKITDIDEQGIPNIIANPILETQLANTVPLVDTARIETVLKRDAGRLKTHARAWANMRVEADKLSRKKRAGQNVDKALDGVYRGMDMLSDALSAGLRVWKYTVLFRLGYPMRIILDDHARIYAQMGATAMLAPLKDEVVGNIKYNMRGRTKLVREQRAKWIAERDGLEPLISDEAVAAWDARDIQIRKLNQRIDALEGGRARAVKRAEERDVDDALVEQAGRLHTKAADLRAERDQLQRMQSDNPRHIRDQVAHLNEQVSRSDRALRKGVAKKRRGQNDLILDDGTTAQGAFGGVYGDAYRKMAGSETTWRSGMLDVEGRVHSSVLNDGNWEVIVPTEVNEVQHLTAWADVLNNQFRQSKVAMHFIEGGDVESFVRWVKEPAQADLRRRLPHYANDPEDWGNRVDQLVTQYAGTGALRQAVREGGVTQDKLRTLWGDKHTRPSVHGATVATNLGHSRGARAAGNFFNTMFKYISEVPTDKLSRHPYFAAVYKSELNELHMHAKAQAGAAGRTYGAADLRRMENIARKRSLKQLKQTLFDIESHSGAAHTARFVSPFFAAHQEAMQRWWRIISDDPSVVRRIQQTFDMPRKLGLTVDRETGEPVAAGEMMGPNHEVILRIPANLGGNTGFGKWINKHTEEWVINENSMNLLLQGGSPLNPGVGPTVSVPAEILLHQLSDKKELEKVVRLFNPYPSDNAMEQLVPATVNRLNTLIKGEKSGEFMQMWQTNFDDRLVKFMESSGGRWPDKDEQEQLWLKAKDETQVESVFRFFQNAVSPFPARPKSKFAAMQQGWQKLREQGESNGKGYDWAIEQWKEKYGEAYLPLIQSQSVNAGDVPVTNNAVASIKRHRSLLNKLDPKLHGMVVGPEGAYDNENEYSSAAAQYLRTHTVKPGSNEKYLSYEDPEQGFRSAATRQGWSEYSDVIDSLNAMAVDQGLVSYRDSDQLVALKDRAVGALRERNGVWAEEFDSEIANPKAYDHTLEDLTRVATDKTLSSDPARTDVQHLKAYLRVREVFAQALALRAQAGGASTMQAQANADLQRAYIQVIGQLEESNLDFGRHFIPIIERDPFLRTDDPALDALVG